MAEITLGKIRNTSISELYKKLIKKEEVTQHEYQALFTFGLIFINEGTKEVQKFGYHIIIKTALSCNNFRAIYDLAINLGYYPLVRKIEDMNNGNIHENILNLLLSSFLINYSEGDIFLTEQQKKMISDYSKNNQKSVAVVAPTSYGKSELIIKTVSENTDCNICIIVPTKALLSQTKKRIIKSASFDLTRKIITHPDMYTPQDANFVAVLTQERLLRLIENHVELNFGTVVIDEAHNLLSDDSRNRLLALSIIILKSRNNHTSFKFLSPFLIDVGNLSVRYADIEINEQRITEHLKIDNFYCLDLQDDRQLYHYDQFLNTFTYIKNYENISDIQFITDNSGDKNIVYVNSPPKLENVAKDIARGMSVTRSDTINKACEEIGKYLHEDYKLIQCLKHGVVYHHGSVPDIVKLYIENLYSSEIELKYIVCSSTLLEGVNIPAEKLFLLDYRKGRGRLTPSQFKNLNGRICRFSEIFSKQNQNLQLLSPEVYLIKSSYMRTDANIKKFLRDCTKEDKSLKDKIDNVLLEQAVLNNNGLSELKNEEEFLNNFEEGIVDNNELRKANTEIGILCYKNGIKEIDIIANESHLQEQVDVLNKTASKASTPLEVIEMISLIFLNSIEDNDENTNILRLSNEPTQRFYAMFLGWIMRSAPFSELIGRFMSYWDRLIKTESEPLVFVGKWGDEKRGGFRPLWINLKNKSRSERINLSILRIKEEQDFVENTIVKFIEVLNDLGLIEEDIYKEIKYGTSNEKAILMIKNGYSNSLASLLLSKYPEYLVIDIDNNTVFANDKLIQSMKDNGENDILIFEATYNTQNG